MPATRAYNTKIDMAELEIHPVGIVARIADAAIAETGL